MIEVCRNLQKLRGDFWNFYLTDWRRDCSFESRLEVSGGFCSLLSLKIHLSMILEDFITLYKDFNHVKLIYLLPRPLKAIFNLFQGCTSKKSRIQRKFVKTQCLYCFLKFSLTLTHFQAQFDEFFGLWQHLESIWSTIFQSWMIFDRSKELLILSLKLNLWI